MAKRKPSFDEQGQRTAEALADAATSMAETLKAQQEAVRNLPSYPGYVQTPPFTCFIKVSGVLVATIDNVPNLSPILDLFAGVCGQNQSADTISLELSRRE